MDPKDIAPRLKATGKSQIALGRAIGKKKDSVSRLLRGEREMTATEAEQIKAFFGDDQPRGPVMQRIPVYGYAAAGGDDYIALATDLVLEYIEIPAGLIRGEPMAIRINGESMLPRLRSKELAIVGMGLRPSKGDDCVVELSDETALVKEYVVERDGVVFLRQLNPDREIRIDATKVRSIRAVQWTKRP